MKQLLIGGAVLLDGATGVVIAMAEQRQDPILIAGDKPVTEAQVSQKLQSEGYSNVQITSQGRYIYAAGSKDGTTAKLAVDSHTGRVSGADDDNDGDD